MGPWSGGGEADASIGHSIHDCAGEGNDAGYRQGREAPLGVRLYKYGRRPGTKVHEAGEQIVDEPARGDGRPGERGQEGGQESPSERERRREAQSRVHERGNERRGSQGYERRGQVKPAENRQAQGRGEGERGQARRRAPGQGRRQPAAQRKGVAFAVKRYAQRGQIGELEG